MGKTDEREKTRRESEKRSRKRPREDGAGKGEGEKRRRHMGREKGTDNGMKRRNNEGGLGKGKYGGQKEGKCVPPASLPPTPTPPSIISRA